MNTPTLDKMRLLFILISFNFLLFSYPKLNAQNNIDYSFFIAGHTYGNTKNPNIGLFLPFKQKFAYIKSRPEIKFGVLLGDIVRPNPTEDNWNKVDADIDTLGLPVYFAVGNHDMENRELFEERYGDTYYSFKSGNDLFVVLDPNLDNWNISGEQLAFLKNVMAEQENEIDHLFVFFHQILWWKENSLYTPYRPNSFAGKADSINYWTELEPMFKAYSKPVFLFAGDFGAAYWSADFMYDNYDNISMIASGMGEESGDNFVVVNVMKDNTIDYDLICLSDDELECFGELTSYRLTTNSDLVGSHQKAKIFPNPATNQITVEINSTNISNASISIFNTSGIKVFEQKIFQQTNQVSLNLDDGLYLFSIKSENEIIETGKIVVVH